MVHLTPITITRHLHNKTTLQTPGPTPNSHEGILTQTIALTHGHEQAIAICMSPDAHVARHQHQPTLAERDLQMQHNLKCLTSHALTSPALRDRSTHCNTEQHARRSACLAAVLRAPRSKVVRAAHPTHVPPAVLHQCPVHTPGCHTAGRAAPADPNPWHLQALLQLQGLQWLLQTRR